MREADVDSDYGRGQEKGRSGGGRDSGFPQAGALQGQGHHVSGREDRAQRRQEEVGRQAMPHIKKSSRGRRRDRVRFQIRIKSAGRPRLSVFRSSLHIYAQVIDDSRGVTLATASSLDKQLKT